MIPASDNNSISHNERQHNRGLISIHRQLFCHSQPELLTVLQIWYYLSIVTFFSVPVSTMYSYTVWLKSQLLS